MIGETGNANLKKLGGAGLTRNLPVGHAPFGEQGSCENTALADMQ